MACWLWTIPASNFDRCIEARVFAVRNAGINAAKAVRSGDTIFAYVPGQSVIAAVLQATSGYYTDTDPIWPDGVYPHRVRIRLEKLIQNDARVPLKSFKDDLHVGANYPNFGLVVQKVVVELDQHDCEILTSLTANAPAATSPVVLPLVPAAEPQALLERLEIERERVRRLQRQIEALEDLLALVGPNLEDYLRLASSNDGPAFEEATRKCFVALGFELDAEFQGQAGEIDFVAIEPYHVFGECQVSGSTNVGVDIVDKLMRHRRRYLNKKAMEAPRGDCSLVICEATTTQLLQDASTEGVGVLRPSQIAALVKLKREYPGAVNPFNLKTILQAAGDLNNIIAQFVDSTREQVDKRVGIIQVLKNDRYGRVGQIDGRSAGWVQAQLERELESHIPLSELKEILGELTSPLVGCVGVTGRAGSEAQYYFIRDYDFPLGSATPDASALTLRVG